MWTTLDTFDTIYSADSVEWCPIEGFKDLFVCGTYQLNDGEEKVECPEGANPDMPLRVGKIYLFRVINSVLKLLQTLETDAILDMKWAHVKIRGNILLAIGDAKGFLKIYRLGVQDDTPRIKLLVETRVQPSEIELLVLSLDWNTGRCTDDTLDDVRIVVSDNKGAVSIYKLTGESFDLETITKKHEYEAWITCFDYWNTNIIYSGKFFFFRVVNVCYFFNYRKYFVLIIVFGFVNFFGFQKCLHILIFYIKKRIWIIN